MICSRTSPGASLNVVSTSVRPLRRALLIAVRMSCHFLPRVCQVLGMTSISVPTWIDEQPNDSKVSRELSCTA